MLDKLSRAFVDHKYLYPSASLFIALLGVIAFRSDSVNNYFSNLFNTLIEAAILSFAIFLFQMFAGWFFFPILLRTDKLKDHPKKSTFLSYDEEISNYFFVLIYFVISIVLALQITK